MDDEVLNPPNRLVLGVADVINLHISRIAAIAVIAVPPTTNFAYISKFLLVYEMH
jgi:hypothetical protein